TASQCTGFLQDRVSPLSRHAWERRRDRQLGEVAREERDFAVETEKKREEEHPPLRIEPTGVAIKKSARVQEDTQAPLCHARPHTPLPPLKLLDDATGDGERVTPETLEFTSRLI